MVLAFAESLCPFLQNNLRCRLGAAIVAALVLVGSGAWAQVPAIDPAEREALIGERSQGLFLTVRNPLDSANVTRLMRATEKFLDRPDKRGLKIVYDFNPEGRPSCTSEYGPCHDLARFLLDLQDVTTIAYVHDEAAGFTVLPVLACKEIVMSSKGVLGDALREQTKPLRPSDVKFFEEVAQGRGRCPALVLKTVEKNMDVLKGTFKGGIWYVDKAALEQEKKAGFVATSPEPVLRAGAAGLYTATQARDLGLCNLTKENRQEVAAAYRLAPGSLREDPLKGSQPVAWRVTVKGKIDGAQKETLERTFSQLIGRHKANFIILQLECGGGETQVASDLAKVIRNLKDDNKESPLMTVAYVTEQARDTAAFLAFACSEIVMDRRAKLGNFQQLIDERPKYRDSIYEMLRELVREQGYPPLLARAMLFKDATIHRVRNQKGDFIERRLVEGTVDAEKWVAEQQIKAPDQWWSLDAPLAKELGVTELVVEGPPADALPKIYAHYGIQEPVHEAEQDWLSQLAAFLRDPKVSVILIMIGIAGLVLELKIPGISLPGVISAICFVLYFWAQSQLAGHLTMLAVLLFILGLILIGLEVFVLPGFGVTGISGIILVVVSLALATLVKKPETSHEWLDFGATISTVGLALAGALVGGLMLAWYLPHIPYVSKLVLRPPTDKTATFTEEELVSAPAKANLLGAIGVAVTELRPAGKVKFAEEFVDVVAEGIFVLPGAKVQVIEIEGNRVVVKEIS